MYEKQPLIPSKDLVSLQRAMFVWAGLLPVSGRVFQEDFSTQNQTVTDTSYLVS